MMDIEKADMLARQFSTIQYSIKKTTAYPRHGYHENKKAGTGGSFFQFRGFEPNDPLQSIDWRKSAKSDKFVVQDKEREVAHTIWLWGSRSPTMGYHSGLVPVRKRELTELVVLTLAAIFRDGASVLEVRGIGTVLPAGSGFNVSFAGKLLVVFFSSIQSSCQKRATRF